MKFKVTFGETERHNLQCIHQLPLQNGCASNILLEDDIGIPLVVKSQGYPKCCPECGWSGVYFSESTHNNKLSRFQNALSVL